MTKAPFILLIVFLSSCQMNNADQEKISQLQSELAAAKAEITALKETPTYPLVHVVYLDVKADISEMEMRDLKAAIENLKKIPEVKHLTYGNFKNLEDDRALSDFEMVFQMNFANAADYAIYQAHPIHLALKETGKNTLAAPPVTYDYMLEK